jgi:hypothetical protein
MVGTEDRLAEGAPHEGGRRRTQPRPNRHPAAAQDTGREDRAATENQDEIDDDEYLERFKENLDQSVLPNLPPMPGYHVCWLTTSNPRDTVANRIRMGYELITDQMVPGFEGASPKSAQFPGVLTVNEMLAARIPVRLYLRMMKHVHHDLPLSEEEKLRAQVDGLKEDAERQGGKVLEGDGMAEIVQRANSVPVFER